MKVNYATRLPLKGLTPVVYNEGLKYHKVRFFNGNGSLMSEVRCQDKYEVFSTEGQQWFTKWHIKAYDKYDKLMDEDVFDPTNKTVFIKIDSYALGDTLAWIHYVEIFRLKYGATVLCSSFWNKLLKDSYPNILFIEPNIQIDNVYAQYYIGATAEKRYCPVDYNTVPLQMVAPITLGLELGETRPVLFPKLSPRVNETYVTLSEFGSSSDKAWKAEKGWQGLVDYLTVNGVKVVVISKEPTSLNNVENMSGNIDILDRVSVIKGALFHVGVSSGLSWLAWALGKDVLMISDVTPKWHEFCCNRVGGDGLAKVDYTTDKITGFDEVKTELDKLLGKYDIEPDKTGQETKDIS